MEALTYLFKRIKYKTGNALLAMIIIFCFISNSRAQENSKQIDSILQLSRKALSAEQALTLSTHLYQRSKALGYKSGMANSLIFTAINLFNQSRYDEALKAIIVGEELAKELDSARLITRALRIKANCFVQTGFVKKARYVLKEAQMYAEKINDEAIRLEALGGIFRIYSESFNITEQSAGSNDSIVLYAKMAHREMLKIKNPSKRGEITLTALQLGQSYLRIKKYDSAGYYLDEALMFSRKNNQKIYTVEILMAKGLMHYKKDEFKAAQADYEAALAAAQSYKNNTWFKDIYLGLSNVYDRLGDAGKSNFYLKKYVEIFEKVDKLQKIAIIKSSDYIVKENEKIYQDRKDKEALVMRIAILLFSITSIFYFVYFRKFKNEKEINARKEQLIKEKIALLNELYPKEILDNDALNIVMELAFANNPSFFLKFNELYPGFINKLLAIAPTLVTSELELCAYMKLNFETKEIAGYKRLSVRSVQGIKYRIRKKLHISGVDDLNSWMMDL